MGQGSAGEARCVQMRNGGAGCDGMGFGMMGKVGYCMIKCGVAGFGVVGMVGDGVTRRGEERKDAD